LKVLAAQHHLISGAYVAAQGTLDSSASPPTLTVSVPGITILKQVLFGRPRAITAGAADSAALKTDGSLWAWGSNGAGALGDGTFVNKNYPVRAGTGNDWSTIGAGYSHVVALKND